MRSHHLRHTLWGRLQLAALLSVVASSAFCASSSAYWTSTGQGSAFANLTTLPAPTISTETAGAETVQLAWSSVSAPGSGTVEYYVTRDGGSPGGNCPTSAAHSTALTCTDTGVAIGSHTYVVTAVWRTWSTASTGKAVSVTYGPATHLVLSASNSSPVTGEADNLTVVAKDASGNTVLNYTGSHNLVFEGAAEAPSGTHPTVTNSSGAEKSFGEATAVTFTEGQATVSGSSNGVLKLYKAEEAKVKVTEGSLSNGSGLAVKVAAGAFASFHVVPSVAEPEAGAAFEVKLTAWDTWHNTITTYTRSAKLKYEGPESSPSGHAPEYGSTEPTFASGEATVTGFKLYKAAATTLKVKEETTAHEGSASFTVKAAAVKKLSVPAITEREAGVAFNLAVTAVDEWGNTSKTYTGTKTLAWSGPSSAPNGTAPEYPSTATSVSFSEGVGTATAIKLYDAQTTTLTVKEAAVPVEGVSNSFTVKPGSGKFNVPTPTEREAGVAFNVELKLWDSWHNVITTYTGTKPLTWSGPSNAPNGTAPEYPSTATSVSFSEGVGTATAIKLRDAQTTTLTVKEGSNEGTSGSFTVKAAALKRFTVAVGEQTAGTAFSVTLTAGDEWGNPVKTWTGAKTLAWSSPAASSPAGNAPEISPSTATSVTFTEGVGTATGIKLYDAQSTTLTVKEATAPLEGTSASFTVKAGAPSRFAWSHPEVSAGAFEGLCLFTCVTSSIGNKAKFKSHLSVTDAYGNIVSNLGVTEKAKVEKASGEGTLTNATGVTIPSSGAAESTTVFEYTSPNTGTSEASLTLKRESGTTYTEATAHVKY